MLTHADVRRRRIGGTVIALIGAVLIVLAFMAFTGRLGATDKSYGASEEAKSAGAQASQSVDSGASGEAGGSADAEQSDGAPTSQAPVSSEAPQDPKAPLTVLNGGAIAGLAASGQVEFEAAGWEVVEIGNYVGDVPVDQSTVFYPSDDKQAQAAAEALVAQYPELVAEHTPNGLGFEGVVVVLAGDWTPGG